MHLNYRVEFQVEPSFELNLEPSLKPNLKPNLEPSFDREPSMRSQNSQPLLKIYSLCRRILGSIEIQFEPWFEA